MDVSVPDAAAREDLSDFLAALCGWTFEVGGPETGYYTMAFSNGAPVAAINTDENGAGIWVPYFAAPDITATVAAVGAAGGQVFMGPMQVMAAGTMALARPNVARAAGKEVTVWWSQGFYEQENKAIIAAMAARSRRFCGRPSRSAMAMGRGLTSAS